MVKLNRWACILVIILKTVSSYGQDTVSIYFESGHSKIHAAQLELINSIPLKYDISELDSVYYIGMADSIGDAALNLRLSEKRARNIASSCKRFLTDSLCFKVIAIGENIKQQSEKSRRVDVVLYFPPSKPEEADSSKIVVVKESCYHVDYKLLRKCHVRKIIKGKKKNVLIWINSEDLENKTEHYYASISKKAEIIVKPVKWSFKKAGRKAEQNNICKTTIPAEDFQRFRLFKISSPPCDTCHEDLLKNRKLLNKDSSMQIDKELMKVVEVKINMFNLSKLRIRAPKTHVCLDDNYYAGCDATEELSWKKKKKKYYHSKLPIHTNVVSNITRIREYCKYNPEPPDCSQPFGKFSFYEGAHSFLLHGEVGGYCQLNGCSPYAGLGIVKEEGNERLNLLLSTNKDFNFCSAINYQHHFFYFPLSILKNFSLWLRPGESTSATKFVRMYAGTELKLSIVEPKHTNLEQNLQIGMAYMNNGQKAFIPRIFVQYGIVTNYLNKADGFYSIVQAGINMKLMSLSKK
jgi:hypothetical protein